MKRVVLFVLMLLVAGLSGCAYQSDESTMKPAYEYLAPERPVGYEADVKPILTQRCVVCHSCYNSPCQLKLSSWEGFDRGASKEAVYNAKRTETMEPTRLFFDAETTEEWREKGFFSVKPDEQNSDFEDSVIYALLDHKRKKPDLIESCSSEENFFSEDEEKTCAQSTAEVNEYLRTHPNRGMPFGFPPLSQQEFNTVVAWLIAGAKGPDEREKARAKAIPDSDQQWIDKWEQLLNWPSAKNLMTGRYLYEHLFLAHITFQKEADAGNPEKYRFYELVRSSTPPGEPIKIIATTRPYDSPGTIHTFYRFRKIHSIIVHKTHMVFPMDQDQYDLVNKLFLEKEWVDEPVRLQGYDPELSANPFEVFHQIPVRSRYTWLLDNARYTIMTFIRGPVCKGQVALNVVNDQFWLFFMDPEYDVSVKYPDFFASQYANLRMPAEVGSMLRFWRSLLVFKKYKRWAHDYYRARQEKYRLVYPEGLGLEAIWKGRNDEDQPVLTIFRHFDSASVHRGALGKLPKTAWVVDYPILERIYYALVAGFDVFGAAGHQTSTRRYMDALRIEAESSFLQFMPKSERQKMMDYWYQGELQGDLDYHKTNMVAAFPFKPVAEAGSPKRQLLEALVRDHIRLKGIETDANYLEFDKESSESANSDSQMTAYIKGFLAVAYAESSFFTHVDNKNANVAWVRINRKNGEPLVLSVVVDRWHDNVKQITGEEKTLHPEQDKADFIRGFVGSYPNYFFVVEEDELPKFYESLREYDGSEVAVCRIEKFGINRAEPQFWEVSDWFLQRQQEELKIEAGIFDLNRYYSLAMRSELYAGGTKDECDKKFGTIK